jgi:deoxyuridine 5'-triphosphate nucleotidohydrolase
MSDLKINILPDGKYYWIHHPTYANAKINEDVGLDIPMINEINVPKNSRAYTVDLGFKGEQNHGYMLVPRSSISKTPLRLANSIGIIDKNYRGNVMVKVDNISDKDFLMEEGRCYFQIVSFSGNLPEYKLVNKIGETKRGEGGFGSTTN